jgi:hypothetical protein
MESVVDVKLRQRRPVASLRMQIGHSNTAVLVRRVEELLIVIPSCSTTKTTPT